MSINRPIRANYPNSFMYQIDLIFYFIKKYQTTVKIVSSIVVFLLITLIVYAITIDTHNQKSLVLLESVSDDVLLYINDYNNITNKEELKNKFIPSLKEIEKKYFFSVNYIRVKYYFGLISFVEADYKTAIYHFKRIIRSSNYLTPFAYSGIIKSYLNMKDYKNALQNAKEFYAKFKKTQFGAMATFMIGDVYRINGNPEKALEYYQNLDKNYKDSSFNQEAFYKNTILLIENQLKKTEVEAK